MNKSNATKYLKLPFQFDEKLLREDLSSISSKHWNPQIYKMNYNGEWTSIALISKGGTNDNFAYADFSDDTKETEILSNCPYFKNVINHFKCPMISVRLLKLCAHSEIKPHRDYKLGYEDDNFRIHIPIVTNDQIEFILEGERLKMLPGECWYTNVNFTHSVTNKSLEDRIHLVIDGERNKWSDNIFFSLAPKDSFKLKENRFSIESKREIIEALKNRNEPELQELINKLEAELESNT